jgi:hypothetical protein
MHAAGITGTPRGDFRRMTTRKSSDEALESGEPRSLTIYDWFSLCFIFAIYNHIYFPCLWMVPHASQYVCFAG